MADRIRLFLVLAGLLAIGTALRRYGDLGDLLGTGAFWFLLAGGAVSIVAGAKPGAATDATSFGPAMIWMLVLGSIWLLALPTELAVAAACGGGLVLLAGLLGRRQLQWRLAMAVVALGTAVAIAMGWRVSDPGPTPMAAGITPKIIETAVISTGRMRMGAAVRIASTFSSPSARS